MKYLCFGSLLQSDTGIENQFFLNLLREYRGSSLFVGQVNQTVLGVSLES